MLNVQNLVSITEFRNSIAVWLKKAEGQTPVVIMQNSKPRAIVMDPDYYEYLERYAGGHYDAGDAAELRRAKKNNEKNEAALFNPSQYR